MINPITFDSQMAMAGALSSILGHGTVTESAKAKKTEKKLVVESEQNGAATASATQPVADNKPESKPETTAKVEKVCESDTAKARLDKFRAEHKAKKFSKQLKTCCESKKVCECGDADKKKQTGAPVENPSDAGAEGAAVIGEDEKEVTAPAENAETTDAGTEDQTAEGGDADAGTPEATDGVDAEGDNGDAGDDGKKELVAHASAVSERMASLKEKLVQELDADDGLKLGNKDEKKDDDAGEGETEQETATVDGTGVDQQ